MMSDIKYIESENLHEHYNFIVDKKQSLLRIDKFLLDKIPNITRNKLQAAIKSNYVKVNDVNIKSNYKVKPNDQVKILLPECPSETEVVSENIDLNIVYEDNHLLIVNKPKGMVVHPAYNNWTGTLVNGLVYHFKNLPNKEGNIGRPGLVHRIDKDTSGLLVIAKDDVTMTSLSKQFTKHTIDRKYYALIWGIPEKDADTINIMLRRSPKDRRIIVSTNDENFGKKSITHYKVIKRYKYVTLIECTLETGRTHQIRAHMKHIGHPIFGDTSYGGDKIIKGPIFSKYKSFINNCFSIMSSQALHAKYLGFIHPKTNSKIEFNSELPDNFKLLLEKWDKYNCSYQISF